MKDFAKSIMVGNSIHTKEEAKTKDQYFKILKFYQMQGYKTKAGEYNPNGSIKLHKGDDSVEIVLVGNSKVGNGINVPPVNPSQKPGTKPQDKPGNNPKKPNEKEPEKPFSKYIEEAQKNGNSTEKLFYGLSKDAEKEEEKSDDALDELKKTGNKYNIKPMSYKADAYRYGKELAEQDFKNFKYSNTSTLESIYRNNTSGEDYEQYGFSDFKKGYYDTYQQMDKKVGNASEVANSKTGNETYQHKLYPDKYVIIEGKNYKIVTDGKVEKSGELTDAVLYGINQTYKRVGNVSSEYEILKQDPSKMHPMYKKAYEEAMKKLTREDEEFKKRFEKEYGVKAKNEASDDKFAYVMREFDEGKLKTPDGKVVTDPEQAKAIAYSESKKTENGLARARNAMKCGNWNSERSVKPVGQYKDFIHDLKNAIMLDVAAVTYNGIDEQTLKSWVEQAKKEGYASAIKGVQGKKVILDTY